MVTGGTGSLGYHLLNVITKVKGDLISFSEAPPHPYRQVRHAQYVMGDLLNFKDIKAALREHQPREIYHLASQSSVQVSHQKPFETLHTNILGTQNLLEAVRQVVPHCKVMLLSSSEIYGKGELGLLDILREETDSPKPLTPFASSKACMELIGIQFCEAYGMHITITRPFHYTGPYHSRRFALPHIASQLIRIKNNDGEPIIYTGNLDVSRDTIDGRDLARALVLIMNVAKPKSIYNICSGQARTLREMVDELIYISKLDVELRLDPKMERVNDIPLLVGSPQKIITETGWKPIISIEDSLVDMYHEMEQRVDEDVKLY